MIKTDFFRMLKSPKFVGAIIGTMLIYLVNALCLGGNVMHDSFTLLDATAAPFFQLALLIFAALPYATSFCEDWNNRYIRSVAMRTSIKNYVASKMLNCFVGSWLVGTLGLLLMLLVTIPFVQNPFIVVQNNLLLVAQKQPTGINWFAVNKLYLVWFVLYSGFRALRGCIYALLALYISTQITNILVTLTMPIICCALYENIAGILQVPDLFEVDEFSQDIALNFNTTFSALLLVLGIWVILTFLFYKAARSKLANE